MSSPPDERASVVRARPGPTSRKEARHLVVDGGQTFVKQHRLPQMTAPVFGIGRLLVGDPFAGDVGDERKLRRLEVDAAQQFDQRSHCRLHHHRVEGM